MNAISSNNSMTRSLSRVLRGWCRTMKTVSKSDRVPLAYDLHETFENLGNPSPLIILHGLFGSKRNYRGISRVLARDLGRPVYAVDLRNHGDSPYHSQHDYISMAEDLSDFIISHALKEPTLIGHSMGAKAVMVLSLLRPSLVRDIVLVDNAPVRNMFQSDFAKYIEGMKMIEKEKVQKQSEADKILQPYVESLPVRQFLLSNIYLTEQNLLKCKLPLDTLKRSLDNLRSFPIQDSNLYTFNKPALFLRGTRSKYITDEMLHDIKKFFPQFRLVDIQAGHWLISENPEEFRKGILKFSPSSS